MNEDNKYDSLKEIFQRNLENHRIPVDSSDWKRINNRLHGKSSSKKKSFALWGAVAASLAIILTLTYRFENSNVKEIADFKNDNEYPKPKNDNLTLISDSVYCEKSYSHQVKYSSLQGGTTKQTGSSENALPPIDCFEQSSRNDDNNDKTDVKEPEKQPTEKQINKPENNTLIAVDFPSIKKRKKNELLLAASFGTNSGIGNNTNYSTPERNLLLDNGKNSFPNNELIPSNTDGEYSPPLSFGLSIRKNLNSHWGIETGLVYTYLSSVYRWNNGIASDATQQLHYLGIPLNGVVYLWNKNPKWNIYLSFGAMLEKGLWMKTTRNEHFGNYTTITTQKSDIDGWQWSLNSSLGISYRFTDKVEFYIEPRFSYFFDNDQPMSIRTDWPVSVGVGGGLRYSF